ncbi:MAG: flippase-like domain-containing protein [Acidobacteria bacterium]|nr:flippase-like domain-containing protein [Acidobacteriota bacterium]
MRSLAPSARALTLRRLLVTLMTLIGVWLFARAMQTLGVAQIRDGLTRVGWGFAVLLLLSGAREAMRTLAWTHSVEGPARLGFVQAFRARLAGEAIGTLLPMGILAGEPAKAAHVGRQVPFGAAFAGLAVEFAFYGASLIPLMAAGGILALVSTAKLPAGTRPLMLGGLLATAAVVVAVVRIRRNHAGETTVGAVTRGGRVKRLIAQGTSAIRRVADLVLGFSARHPERLRPILAYETAYQVLAVAEVYLTLRLISPIPPTLASAVVLETVGRAITIAFQALPLRIGVDEAGAALFAGRLDLGTGTGITLALVRKLRLLFWSGIGLLLLGHPAPAVTAASRPEASGSQPCVIAPVDVRA